ncbi:MAG: hemerythrin domain-containing protein [Verrucomicrobia bacterium]|nr:hemerythrin domain-containing protein [Verrucomicrobiota bacterium]
MNVTDVLVNEHMFLRTVFVAVERALDKAQTLAEVSMAARLVEGLMREHMECEESLLFRPLDALLKEKGQTCHLSSEHREHTALIRKAQTALSVQEGRSDLLLAFRILRAHFHDEERLVIRLAQTTLQPQSQETLGKEWLDRRAQCGHVDNPPSFKVPGKTAV